MTDREFQFRGEDKGLPSLGLGNRTDDTTVAAELPRASPAEFMESHDNGFCLQSDHTKIGTAQFPRNF
jgi:hypothetical protein